MSNSENSEVKTTSAKNTEKKPISEKESPYFRHLIGVPWELDFEMVAILSDT